MLRIRKRMNWSAERVFWICEITSISAGVLAVVAASLAVAALVGQVLAGRIVNQRQATELLQLKADVAEQQARAANAEARLLELKNRISWRKVPEVFAKTHYAKMSNEIPHAEPMPTTAIGIWLGLRELGNRRAGSIITTATPCCGPSCCSN
jgi:hypothetical protein